MFEHQKSLFAQNYIAHAHIKMPRTERANLRIYFTWAKVQICRGVVGVKEIFGLRQGTLKSTFASSAYKKVTFKSFAEWKKAASGCDVRSAPARHTNIFLLI
jgi:hypothetical protein